MLRHRFNRYIFFKKKMVIHKYMMFHKNHLEPLKFKFIYWLYDRGRMAEKLCWADCVSWAYGYDRINPFKIESPLGCQIESTEPENKTHTCYCGAFVDGQCFNLLTDAQQEAIRKRNNSEHEESFYLF